MTRFIACLVGVWLFAGCGPGEGEDPTQVTPFPEMDREAASLFAGLALHGITREYPNKLDHVMNGKEEVLSPSALHPVFYGSYDWHSCVHGHWLLLRLLRTRSGQLPPGMAEEIEAALNRSFSPESVTTEVAYFEAEGRKSYERPYGVAWFLQLTAELREWDDPRAKNWLQILVPLEAVIVQQLKSWLPKLAYAIRLGTHNQSMFAFGLIQCMSRCR